MVQTKEEKLAILNRIAKPSNQWKKEAEWRIRNRWWINTWNRVKLRYYRVMRKVGLRK